MHDEFRRILRFWFDRGVAGFRIDVAHGLYKDALLRDNPPAESNGPLGSRFGQRPVFNENRPEVHDVYREWRSIAETYSPPTLLLGETWVGDLRQLAAFYGQDDELNLAFNFPMVFARFSADGLASVVADTLSSLPDAAWPAWTASNHDVGRLASRWCGGNQAKVRLALLVLATLPGTMVLYYGDEIGMTDVDVLPELARDTLGGRSRMPGRDRARTPMQWDGSPTGGFTASAARSWLPVGDTRACNVATQREDPASVLSFCRELLTLRRELAGDGLPGYERLPGPDGVWQYRAGELTVSANFTSAPVTVATPPGTALLSTAPDWLTSPAQASTAGMRNRTHPATLAPWEGVVSGPTR